MAPTVQQAASSWKELIDNGNLALASGNENDNATVLDVNSLDPNSRSQAPWPPHQSSSPNWGSGGASGLMGGSDLLPVYCGLLGCLIVGLVAWILVKQMLRRGASGHDEKPSGCSDSVPQQQQQQQQRQQQQQQQQQQILFQFPLTIGGGFRRPKRRSADSGFGGSEPTEEDLLAEGVFGRRLLRELSESRLQRLENILANDADPEGWRKLAKELGLTPDELSNLERQAIRGGQQLAIREMLRAWSGRSSASVGNLICCLRRVGRADALILFRESPLTAGKSSNRRHRIVRLHRRQRERQQQQLGGNDEALEQLEAKGQDVVQLEHTADDCRLQQHQEEQQESKQENQLVQDVPVPVDPVQDEPLLLAVLPLETD